MDLQGLFEASIFWIDNLSQEQPDIYIYIPKDPDPSKLAILRTRTPAIQVQTPPLEGPRILRDIYI